MFRKTTITLLALALICSFPVFSFVLPESGASKDFANAASATSEKAKRLPISLKSNMKSISVKWKTKKNVKRYVIYRTDVTKAVTAQDYDRQYKMSDYKKIAKVSGTKKSYKDKKVKNNHYYAYVVNAYKRVNGKYKLAYTSYDRDSYEYCCRGLGIPELLNGGDGENYTNSKTCIYLYHQTICGVNPSSVVLYRKAEGESKYKKISYKTVEKIRNLAGTIKDTTVKPGTIYYYKIKTKKKYNGKTYYSKLSNVIRIPAVNVTGKYTVSAIPVPDNPDEIIIGFTSDEDNGVLTISQSNWTDGTENDIRALEYSYDNVIWESMEGSKAVIEPGKTAYIKFGGKGIADKDTFSFDEECEGSFVSVSYDSPVFRYHILTVDLVTNTAEAVPLYD